MAADVIRVGMGDDRAIAPAARIERGVHAEDPDAVLEREHGRRIPARHGGTEDHRAASFRADRRVRQPSWPALSRCAKGGTLSESRYFVTHDMSRTMVS